MFTIRQITDDMEQLFQAKSVVKVPQQGETAAHLYCTGEDGKELYFQTGTIYVMNENGKTVGKYYFV